jgi:hypothetical protein
MRAALIVALAMLGLLSGGSMAAAQSAGSAQADPPRRVPRIIVTPRQPAADPYPKRGAAYPGPGYVRDCVAWLEPEARPSGTVIVPRQRCSWVRGHS